MWLLDLLGLPRGASFGFTTGCQAAHVTALAVARHELLRRRGVDVERAGLAGSPRLRVLAAGDRHITVDLALRYLGIGTDALTVLPSDEQGRVHPEVFHEALATDDSAPTIVLAQAGNIHTGAFEDFVRISSIAHQADAWVHVDGASGCQQANRCGTLQRAWMGRIPGQPMRTKCSTRRMTADSWPVHRRRPTGLQ